MSISPNSIEDNNNRKGLFDYFEKWSVGRMTIVILAILIATDKLKIDNNVEIYLLFAMSFNLELLMHLLHVYSNYKEPSRKTISISILLLSFTMLLVICLLCFLVFTKFSSVANSV